MPGTKMWEYALEKGVITEPIEWERLQVFSSYKNSNAKNIDEWIEQRLKSNSYYMNEENIPQAELLKMLAEFEVRLAKVSMSFKALNIVRNMNK